MDKHREPLGRVPSEGNRIVKSLELNYGTVRSGLLVCTIELEVCTDLSCLSVLTVVDLRVVGTLEIIAVLRILKA